MSEQNIGSFGKELSELRREMTEFEGSLKKSALYWKIGGGLLLIFVFAYLTWSYAKIRTFVQPESIAATVDGVVLDKGPELIKEMSNSLIAMAPEVIETGKTQAMEFIPLLRKDLEAMLRDMVKDAVKEYGSIVDSVLSESLKDPANKAIILTISSSPKATADMIAKVGKGFTAEVDKVLKRETGEGLNQKLVQSQKQLQEIRDKLRRLQSNVGLNAQERLERHFLQLVLAETPLAGDLNATPAAPVKAATKKSAAPKKVKK